MSKAKAKPTKVKKMSEREATGLILEYMNTENRPFNSKQVFENIHGKDRGVSAAVVTRIMEDLAGKGKLTTKIYKSKAIFWASQDRFGDSSEDSMKELEKNIKTLQAEEEKLAKLCSQQQRINAKLSQTPYNSNLEVELEAEEVRVQALRERLAKIKGGARIVDPKEKANLEKKYADVRKEWVCRKRKFNEIIDTFEENGALDKKKLKKLKEEIGVEDDESAGVSLANTKVAELQKSNQTSTTSATANTGTTQPPPAKKRRRG